MNKYMGFYELKALNLPTVPWRLFDEGTELDAGLLWTVRTAVESGSDTSLPRAVGVSAREAVDKGRQLLKDYAGNGMVIYYPYFIAEKSGVLDITDNKTVVEAVDKDLWNLVTEGRKDVTIVVPREITDIDIRTDDHDRILPLPECAGSAWETMRFFGDRAFLGSTEIAELLRYASVIRGRFREDISEGKSVMAEWSYAYNTDVRREPVGGRYLVFYELRSI